MGFHTWFTLAHALLSACCLSTLEITMHRSFAASSVLAALMVLAAPLFAQVVPAQVAFAQGVSAQTRDAAGEQGMLDAMNARRAAQGLAPLARDASLDAAALVHSIEMADQDVLEHVSEHTGTPADRVRAAGLSIAEIAENVAMHHSSEAAQQSLEGSEAHLGNMMNPRFTHVGVASVRDERGLYVTQVFGRIEAAPAVAPDVASAPPVEAAPPEIVVPIAPPDFAPDAQASASGSAQVMPGPVVIPDTAQVAPHTTSADGSIVAQVPRGSAATVMVPGHEAGRSVAGYWVCANARWYYYPLPPGAGPGAQLTPDLSVTGPPAGHAPGECISGTSAVAAPTDAPMYAPPPYMPRAYAPPVYGAPPIYSAPPVYAPPRVYAPPVYAPRVYAPPPPPPRRGSRYIVVQPRPGTMVAPYVGGPGVSVEFGISPSPYGRVRVRRGRR